MNLEGDMNAFMSALRNLGSVGNGALRNALGWAESRYWKPTPPYSNRTKSRKAADAADP
jgi:hypothetical protein